MSDADWLDAEAVRELVAAAADKASRDYRVDPETAAETILEVFAASPALREAASGEARADRIARTRPYRDALAEARRRIYYALRRYRPDDDRFDAAVARLASLAPGTDPGARDEALRTLLESHASTRERAAHLSGYHQHVLRAAGPAATLLDVGCGVLPLAFPFDAEGSGVERCVAIDRDPKAVEALQAYAAWRGDGRLLPLRWDIAEGWEPVRAAAGRDAFDLATMLKLVPVVQRMHPELLPVLAAVPARTVLVTGSRASLAKRQNIERRERAVLQRFLELAGWERVEDFETEDEIGWVARTGR